jgi:phosphocarrier protein HPr
MPTAVTKIASQVGLHARPASEFVALAKTGETVLIGRPGEAGVNGKSIVSLLTLGLAFEEEAEITVEGENAEELLAKLVALVETAQ